MIIYYLLPIFVYILYLLLSSNKTSNVYRCLGYLIVFILLFIIAAFRGRGVSRDYENYIDFFHIIKNGGIVTELSEPSYPLIVKLVTIFTDSFLPVFVIYAFLGVFFKLLAFRKIMGLKEGFLAIIIYLSNFYFLHEMTQIRIGLASAFFLLGIQYIIKKEPIKYLICILIGCFFHLSIIITLPFYFINSKRINPIYWVGLLLINLAFYLLHLSLLDFLPFIVPESYMIKLYAYKEFMLDLTNNTTITIFNRFLVYLILNLFLLFNWRVLSEKSEYFIILLKLSFISLSIAFFFYDFYLFAFRFSELIGVVQICLFALIAFVFDKKIVGVTLILLLSLFLILINITLTGLLKPYYFFV